MNAMLNGENAEHVDKQQIAKSILRESYVQNGDVSRPINAKPRENGTKI